MFFELDDPDALCDIDVATLQTDGRIALVFDGQENIAVLTLPRGAHPGIDDVNLLDIGRRGRGRFFAFFGFFGLTSFYTLRREPHEER